MELFKMINLEPGSVAEFKKNENYYDQKHVKLQKTCDETCPRT